MGMPWARMNLISSETGIRRSFEPGIRYPRSEPESNHLETVRGATLQILATSPVVKTSFSIGIVLTLTGDWSSSPGRGSAGSGRSLTVGRGFRGNFEFWDVLRSE